MTAAGEETLESLNANLRIAKTSVRNILGLAGSRTDQSETAWGDLGNGLSGFEKTIKRLKKEIKQTKKAQSTSV